MKKLFAFLLIAALIAALTGCRPAAPADTTPSTQPSTAPTDTPTQGTTETPTQGTAGAETDSAKILANIWQAYAENERFAVYGGAVENSVADAPGDLDISNAEELTGRYLLPQEQLSSVKEAASMVHLMNNNIFTAVVFRLSDGAEMQTVAKALRDNVQGNQWICGQPDKLLVADMKDGHLLMVFGSNDAVNTFKAKLTGVYADATTLYEENIVA